VLFTSAMALMTTLVSGHAEERPEERLAHLAKLKLLIIEEFGYLPFEGADWFLPMLSSRRVRQVGGAAAWTGCRWE
jgi:DNA replication protein DnaC